MPRADFLAFFRDRENLALPALMSFACFITLTVGLAALGGYVSPRGAMLFAALLCAVAAAWYARGFLETRSGNGGVALLLCGIGWAIATLSFLARAINVESRVAIFLLLGATLLVLSGASLALSSLLVGAQTPDEAASTRAAKEDLGDVLRNARDL